MVSRRDHSSSSPSSSSSSYSLPSVGASPMAVKSVRVRKAKWSSSIRELIKLIETKLVILVMLVAEENILDLPIVLTHAEHALEHPQDATGGGGRRWRSRARACGAWRSKSIRDIYGDDWHCQSLWLDVGDLDVLHKVYAHDLLYHHHNL
jgi:hypothetical protein